MSRIFWDTNLFIYLFEDYGSLSHQVMTLLKKMNERGDELLTSTLTVGEITAKPLSQGDTDRCRRYEEAVQSNAVVLPFDLAAARQFARLRATHQKSMRPPDAIQLACAAAAGTDLFLTNDSRLHSLRVDGIHFITSVEKAPL
jgi:predicted nucleic acid-binding protein